MGVEHTESGWDMFDAFDIENYLDTEAEFFEMGSEYDNLGLLAADPDEEFETPLPDILKEFI